MTSTRKIKRRQLAARRYADHYPDPRTWTGRKAVYRRSRDRRTLVSRRLSRKFNGFRVAAKASKRALNHLVAAMREATRAFARMANTWEGTK